MSFCFQYTESAIEDLRNLPKNEGKRILLKIDVYKRSDNPLRFAKKLKAHEFGEYRFRVGVYRIFFDIEEIHNIKILSILRIKHRKDIYRKR